jgi:hypothetical protein
MKLFANWGLRSSEKEIVSFLSLFSQGGVEQNGAVLGMAALLHHQFKVKDPEFETLVNSKKGENHGHISTHIIQLNRLVNEFHKVGRYDEAAAMKLWNITFRCMSHESLHHYGVSLWQVASRSFPEAKKWLEGKLISSEKAGHQRDAPNLKNASNLYNFVPPQFYGS